MLWLAAGGVQKLIPAGCHGIDIQPPYRNAHAGASAAPA
jgi:hypothetical protein